MSRRKTLRRSRQRRTRRIRRKQRGGSSDAIVFKLTNGAGFGSVGNFLCHAYIHAKETGKDFFIENDNWQYSYKDGWHDYFKSLNNLPANPPAHITRYKHADTQSLPLYSLDKYTDCIKNIFVLNDDLVKKAQDFIDNMGSPYKAVYVRMGDKVSGNEKEIDAFSLPELVKIMELPNDSKLFLMTDDYSIKGELEKLLPSTKIFTQTPPENKGSSVHDLRALSKEDMRKHAEELFTSMYILMKAEKAWVWNHSNLGRFMKMGSPDNIVLYPINNELSGSSTVNPGNTHL